jgi:hypothetical protein
MPSVGKYPNDVARERQDVPETYEQNRETFTKAEARLDRGDDVAAGPPPETDEVEPEADERTDPPR